MRFLSLLLPAFLTLTGCGKSQSSPPRSLETSFWIWNRSAPFTGGELGQLKAANVSRVYWQIGEVEWRDGKIVAKAQWPLPGNVPELRFIPVVRLEPTIADPARVDAGQLAAWAKSAGVTDEIQFDYDCPTRLLGHYGELLIEFRKDRKSVV